MASIPVLYIGGEGRSGSTILERSLQKHEQLAGVGELGAIWGKGFFENVTCTCGDAFQDCHFWTRVLQNTFGNLTTLKARYFYEMQRNLLRGIKYPDWVRSFYQSSEFKKHKQKWNRVVSTLYREILNAAGASVIVESSKSLSRALYMAKNLDLNVYVVHLIRDPRGVVYSFYHRPKQLPEYRDKSVQFTRKSPLSRSLAWTAKNSIWELSRKYFTDYRRLRYEDFVQNPEFLTESLTQWVLGGSRNWRTGHRSFGGWHSVSGNPVRFEDTPSTIKLDDEWKKKLPIHERWLVTFLTAPLMARYGYFFQY